MIVFQSILSIPKSVLTAMKVIRRTLNSECKMIMSYEGYQEALESQKQKEDEITELKKRHERFELLIQSLIDSGQLTPNIRK